MLVEVDAILRVERHAFGFEEMSLQLVRVAARPRTHFASRVDDAMPRNAERGGQRMKRVADLSRVTLEPGKLGDLAISRDASAGNLSDDLIDS